MATLPWPLATIDFEASSLEWDGYPIEVGIAVWRAPDAPILGWSALIRPPLAWREGGHWSRTSAKVHGITRAELEEHGLPVHEVSTALNALLALIPIAWCDGVSYDAQWLGSLFRAAQQQPAFALASWTDLLARLSPIERARANAHVRTARCHRAQQDAEHLLLAVAAGLDRLLPSHGDLCRP